MVYKSKNTDILLDFIISILKLFLFFSIIFIIGYFSHEEDVLFLFKKYGIYLLILPVIIFLSCIKRHYYYKDLECFNKNNYIVFKKKNKEKKLFPLKSIDEIEIYNYYIYKNYYRIRVISKDEDRMEKSHSIIINNFDKDMVFDILKFSYNKATFKFETKQSFRITDKRYDYLNFIESLVVYLATIFIFPELDYLYSLLLSFILIISLYILVKIIKGVIKKESVI